MKLLGVALATALLFSGCDSGSSNNAVVATNVGSGSAVTTGGGTGLPGGSTGGASGFGLTGGTLNFGGTGGSGGGTGVATSGGSTTTSTSGGTSGGGTTGSNNFLSGVSPVDFRTGLSNPTAFAQVVVGGAVRDVIVDGFRLGQSGRVVLLNDSGAFNPNTGGFPILEIQRSNSSTFTGPLISPFDVVSDGSNLYVSAGFESNNDGAIIKISNLTVSGGAITGTWQDLTAGVERPRNPSFMTLVSSSGGTFVYWTEYSSSGTGRVRRIRTDGTGTADVIINNLNFPAGIDHDGSRLAVCDVAGGGSSLGRIIVAPISPSTVLNGQSATDVTEIATANPGDQAIRRPFDVVYDGRNGFFFTEGATLPSLSGPVSAGQGNGAVRFIARGQTTAQRVSIGLTNCAGIDAVDSNSDGTTAVLFSESIQSTGTVQRRLVNTANVTLAAPTPVQTGLFSPFAVGIFSENLPSVAALINFTGGVSNGTLRVWGP